MSPVPSPQTPTTPPTGAQIKLPFSSVSTGLNSTSVTNHSPVEKRHRKDEPALEIQNLVKNFGPTSAVAGISFSAYPGEVTSVLGPNGAGKSTTISCCVGLHRPDSGTVRTLNFNPSNSTARGRARVGVMLQDGGLTSGARSGQLLRHTASLYSRPLPLGELKELLGIDSFERTLVRRLSGGERQRLALALALVGRPELVFLDEPTAGMDPQSRHVVWQIIRDLRDEGVAIVLTTHLIDEAEKLSDQVIIIDHGKVLAQGSVSELIGAQSNPSKVRVVSAAPLPDYMLENIPGVSSVTVLKPGEYVLEGTVTPAMIRSIVGLAAQRNVLIREISAGSTSLESTYLDLTGRSLR